MPSSEGVTCRDPVSDPRQARVPVCRRFLSYCIPFRCAHPLSDARIRSPTSTHKRERFVRPLTIMYHRAQHSPWVLLKADLSYYVTHTPVLQPVHAKWHDAVMSCIPARTFANIREMVEIFEIFRRFQLYKGRFSDAKGPSYRS